MKTHRRREAGLTLTNVRRADEVKLVLTIRKDGAKVVFWLRKFARLFNSSMADLPPFGQAREGGYGLLPIQAIMNSVRYTSAFDVRGDLLDMTRRLQLPLWEELARSRLARLDGVVELYGSIHDAASPT